MSEISEPQGGSILDRVLQSQQTVALERFEPVEIVNELLKQLSPKEADVIRRRFGLSQEQPETLERIGQMYKVTRERVRQIERWAIKRLIGSASAKQLLKSLDVLLQQLLEENGGLMLEDDLYEHLLTHSSGTTQARAAVQFLLDELMSDKVTRQQSRDLKPYWKLKLLPASELLPTIRTAEEIIRHHGKPMDRAALFAAIQSTPLWQQRPAELTETAVFSYLSVSKLVERNPFGEWGLRGWGSIVPKRMNDKILLVLRKHGKPMHYLDITKRINEIGFDDRQAYPPTVHNELILSQDYVLVGRGIYALREWGYKPGVVADVLREILKGSLKPMTRDELVAKVLEQRVVKRNTIHLALTNKNVFKKLPDGRYALAGTNTNTNNPAE